MFPTPGGTDSSGAMLPSGTENTGSITGRGNKAAVVGAIIGLVTAIIIGSLRFLLAEEPEYLEQLAGNTALALVYASPYLLTLIVSKERIPAVRGGLLAAFGFLSFVASFSSLSLVTIILIPATFVIWVAAARSLATSDRSLAVTLTATIAGLVVAATVGLSFFALFGIQDSEARCWVLSQGTDGQSIWEPRPNIGGPGTLSVGLLSGNTRSFCVSDIISNTEAAMSTGILAIAFLGTHLISMRRRLLSCGHGSRLPFTRNSRNETSQGPPSSS